MRFTNAISEIRTPFSRNYWLMAFILIVLSVFLYTLLNTPDLNNWMLENTLTVLAFIFLTSTYKKYTFSDVSYLLLCVYLCLHIYGSQYTYAENPLGDWLKTKLGWERNHYDRIVHFSFGFMLAYPWREAFLNWGKFPKWVAWFLPIEMTLSISGIYELIEWAVADIFFKAQGPSYLGTQGDVWDAQKDMGLAFLGAILATTIVSVIKKILKI